MTEERQLLSGNEAIALAALHMGVSLGTGYPGTPSTEILERYSALGGRAQWAPNEKVALEVGIGVASGGARALVTMKHVGVNVAADPLFTVAYTGVRGALVLVSADDPGMASSQNEQDNRRYAKAAGVMMLEPADAQEAYDTAILAVRLAEHKDVLSPVFVCQDGFITSHGFEPVNLLDDAAVKAYVGERDADHPLLDVTKPVTYGSFVMSEYYFEIKRQQVEAMKNVLKVYDGVAKEYEALSGRFYPKLDRYRTEDADFVVVVMSSASGVVKDVVDELREQDIKAGCLRVRMFRPFPAEEAAAALGGAKAVAVLDRALSIGGTAPLAAEVKSALYDSGKSIPVQSCVYGLGGRDFFPQYARDLFMDLAAGKVSREERYLGLLE